MNNSFAADKLRIYRGQKGLTLKEAAKGMKIPEAEYLLIESGESDLWLNHIQSICNFYQIEPDEFFQQDRVIINKVEKGVGYAEVQENFFGYVDKINQLSDKFIEQIETKLKDMDDLIQSLNRNK